MCGRLRPAGLFAVCLIASVLCGPFARAEPRERDWARLRGDVEAEARRPHQRPGSGDFESRRQAIRERAQARYAAADRNRDGGLSREELMGLHPGLARHFDRIDRDGDQSISPRELFEAARERHRLRSGGGPPPDREPGLEPGQDAGLIDP